MTWQDLQPASTGLNGEGVRHQQKAFPQNVNSLFLGFLLRVISPGIHFARTRGTRGGRPHSDGADGVMRVLPQLRDSVSTEEPVITPRPHRIKALFHERLAILLFCCRNRKVYAILLEKQMLNQY